VACTDSFGSRAVDFLDTYCLLQFGTKYERKETDAFVTMFFSIDTANVRFSPHHSKAFKSLTITYLSFFRSAFSLMHDEARIVAKTERSNIWPYHVVELEKCRLARLSHHHDPETTSLMNFMQKQTILTSTSFLLIVRFLSNVESNIV
jgi:hypothetical protein